MALQNTHTEFGTDFTNAYHVVDTVRYRKIHDAATCQVKIYTNDTKEHELCQHSFTFAYDTSGAEALTQAYNYLKTLAEYTGSTDV